MLLARLIVFAGGICRPAAGFRVAPTRHISARVRQPVAESSATGSDGPLQQQEPVVLDLNGNESQGQAWTLLRKLLTAGLRVGPEWEFCAQPAAIASYIYPNAGRPTALALLMRSTRRPCC